MAWGERSASGEGSSPDLAFISGRESRVDGRQRDSGGGEETGRENTGRRETADDDSRLRDATRAVDHMSFRNGRLFRQGIGTFSRMTGGRLRKSLRWL